MLVRAGYRAQVGKARVIVQGEAGMLAAQFARLADFDARFGKEEIACE